MPGQERQQAADVQLTDAEPKVTTAWPAVDLVSPEETALEARISQELERREQAALVDALSASEEAFARWERRCELLERARIVAIRNTAPEHWVLFRDREGRVLAYPTVAACDIIAETYGIQVINLRPVDEQGNFRPEKIEERGGKYTLRGWCDAFSRLTSRGIQSIEVSKASDEKFVGRGSEADLRLAVMTGLRAKATRILAGISRVPIDVLQEAGLDVDRCIKGAGYGSSKQRAAQSVTAGEVKAEAKKLGAEILRRVGGDRDTARDLLRELLGVDSVERVTTQAMVRKGWAKLREHPQFGDAAQEGGE